MKIATQQGFTLPEVLAALAMAGLAISLIGSFSSARIDAGKTHVERTESRYIASLAARANRGGLLTDDVATAADLQTALPHIPVPARLSDGQAYRVALDDDDPRILIDGKTEAVRALFSASELRIPLWRARRLRQTRQEAE